MFRLVVLSVLVAVAAAAPGYLHVVPVATSHQQRVDVYKSNPILTKFISPAVHAITSNDHSEEDIHDYDDSHIYEEDSHDIHLASPFVDTIVVTAPETVKTVSSHHEVHQVHDTPVDDVQVVDVVASPAFESVAVEGFHHIDTPLEDSETLPVEDVHHIATRLEDSETLESHSLPVVHSEEDVHYIVTPLEASETLESYSVEDAHHVAAPLISSVETVESHHEIHQVHDTPVVHSIPSVVAPVVVSHEEVPQVHHEIPVLHSVPLVHTVETVVPVAVSHSSRTDVHQDVVAVPAVHAW